jgi:hypothetical protein
MFEKLMLNKMKKEAERITNDIIDIIPLDCKDKEVLYSSALKILQINPSSLNIEQIDTIKQRCTSIEGVCYMLGLEFGEVLSNDALILRCVQLTSLIDENLYNKGVTPCSFEEKMYLYKLFGLHDAYLENQNLFNLTKNKKINIEKKKDLRNLISTKVDPKVLEIAEMVAKGQKLSEENRKYVLDKIRENPTLYREVFVKLTGKKQYATKEEQDKWFK